MSSGALRDSSLARRDCISRCIEPQGEILMFLYLIIYPRIELIGMEEGDIFRRIWIIVGCGRYL